MPRPRQVGLYVGSGLLALGALVFVAFDEVFAADRRDAADRFAAASGVHLLATGDTALAAYRTLAVPPRRPEWLGFAVAGAAVTLGYNAPSVLATYVVRELGGGSL